ncbi:uncharacterized protein K452DRAFT_308326 [Aplosporella prunicola CBS 121167]|uniref:Apple domain-containing protein n=1 Tax=Aplosporella prunicola CBS 121167 TaxID=1176127 RepID=A0A6A6BIN6_9PEZI|nr:uncharacterized protein K452DRAFT_308326 [Aplosporella prunicola CBS 121167]KAF2142687.1 hypothetical protein K452DRAFT_308326 [Aplosporella prunicola CBS 121167]
MLLNIAAVATALLAVPGVFATPQLFDLPVAFLANKQVTYETSTVSHCFTALGPSSVWEVRTSYRTKTIHPPVLRATITTTPTSTVTPSPVTSTIVSQTLTTVTVTNPAVIDTFSTTSTITVIETVTITPTTTTTETETVSADTTTTTVIPTSSGFFPVQDTRDGYPTPIMNPMKRNLELESHALEHGDDCDCQGPGWGKYPKEVKCVEKIEIFTKVIFTTTASTVTTTLSASTTTVVSVSTATSTSTVVPFPVKTTLSFSTTITTASTTVAPTFTSTTTTTTTIFTSTASVTEYAACNDERNYVTQGSNGLNIDSGFGLINVQQASRFPIGDAYSCCVLCQNNTIRNCAVSYIYMGTSDPFCILATSSDTCTPETRALSYQETGQNPPLFNISNGNCGFALDAGFLG